MKKSWILAFILLGIFLALSPSAQAKVFSVYFYYKSADKTLNFDKLTPQKVSLDQEKFVSVFDFSDETKAGDYVAKLYDDKAEELISGYFTAQPEAFILDIPYISTAASLKIFERETMKEILSASLTEFISCNRNNLCELEKGENLETCLLDCGKSNPVYSQETTQQLQNNEGIIKDSKGEIILKEPTYFKEIPTEKTQAVPAKKGFNIYWIIFPFLTILILMLGFFIYKRSLRP